MNLTQLREAVAQRINGKRLAHTYAVEQESLCLARLFGLSAEETEKLQIASLLHDITKQKTAEEQIELCRLYGLRCTEQDIHSPKTFHARTGAETAKREFALYADEEVCEAIRCHTVGKADMSLFEKLLFLADYIEPTRTFGDCVTLRQMFYDGLPGSLPGRLARLDDILIVAFDMTVADLCANGCLIDRDTCEARNFLLLQKQREDRQ